MDKLMEFARNLQVVKWNVSLARLQWLTPVILACEMRWEGSRFKASPGK
jgi:hypothetical protein